MAVIELLSIENRRINLVPEKKMQDLLEDLEKISLYVEQAQCMPLTEDAEEIDEETEWMLNAVFIMGERVYENEVQDPEQAEIDEQARKMLPSDAQLLAEKIRKAEAEGRDIFDVQFEPITENLQRDRGTFPRHR